MSQKRRPKRKKVLYMAVTPDQYELPLAVADTAAELGQMFGKTKGLVLSSISHNRDGRHTGMKFVRVPI